MPAVTGLRIVFRHFASWIVAVVIVAGADSGRIAHAADPAAGQTWPQLRGPLGTGVAPDANPPIEWSAEKNIRWKAKIPGSGASTPIVWGEQIFLLTAIPTGKKIEPPPVEPAAAPAAEGKVPAGAQSSPRSVPARLVADEKVEPAADAKTAAPADSTTTPPADAKAAPADAKAVPGGDGKGPPDGKGGGRRRGGFGRPQKPTEYFQFVLLCLNRTSGEVMWQQVATEVVPHEGHHQDHGFASYTPATDGACVVAFFGSRGLYCYDMQGKLTWQKDLGKMQTVATFGEGSSPAIHGNTVVIVWDHQGEDFVAAFNKETGDELWRTAREEDTGWVSPVIIDHGGVTQVVLTGNKAIRSYDLATGKQLWECSGLTAAAIPMPILDKGVIYAMSGFRGNALLALRLGGSGDLTGSDSIVWKSDTKDTPYVPSPLLYDGRLYFFKSNSNVLTCMNAEDGKVLFGPERVEGIGAQHGVYASPLGAGGHVYLVGRNGTVVVIKSADTYEVLATNKLDDGSNAFNASPVAVGGDLLLRGKEYLFCIADQSTASAR